MSGEERRTVRVPFSEYADEEGEWPAPEEGAPLSKVVEWFRAKLEAVPEEHRAYAKCTIDTEPDDDDDWESGYHAHIEIWYERPETDEEYERRTAQLKDQRERAREIRARTANTRDRRSEAKEVVRGLGPGLAAMRKKGLTE